MTQGRREDLDRLLERLYDELRQLASRVAPGDREGHTLHPTALVHELYLRLVRQDNSQPLTREAFLAVAAKAMRHILIDHARERGAQKRGGSWRRIALHEADSSSPVAEVDIFELNEAIDRLSGMHERQAQIVEMRFLAGLNVREVADVLEISEETVKRDWRMARAWLMNELGQGDTQ